MIGSLNEDILLALQKHNTVKITPQFLCGLNDDNIVKVIQFRYIKGSEYNGWNTIKTGMRKADAIGTAKSLLVSHMEMLDHHEHYVDQWLDTVVVMDKAIPEYSCSLYENGELVYKIEYRVEEDEPQEGSVLVSD